MNKGLKILGIFIKFLSKAVYLGEPTVEDRFVPYRTNALQLLRLPSVLPQGKVLLWIPLLLYLVIFILLKDEDNHENILIPVGTAIINVAAVKYALVKQKKNAIYIFYPPLTPVRGSDR